MKRVQGLLATLLIFTILVGSSGWIKTTHMTQDKNTIGVGEYTTLENPKPIRE